MKIYPQEVYLHGLGKFPDYVYSMDIGRPFPEDSGRLFVVTGGADSIARVWTFGAPSFQLQIHSELQGHTLGVNCVRFSPDGLNNIATGSDDGKIVIWRPVREEGAGGAVAGGPVTGAVAGSVFTIRWVAYKILNTLDEVVHVSWSPCGQMVAGAAQREMSHLYNVHTGRALQRLDGHSNRVLGIAWDPLSHLIVSLSTDRSARVYCRSKKGTWYVKAQLREVGGDVWEEQQGQTEHGSTLGSVSGSMTVLSKQKLFISESHYPNDPSAHFFRRPEFSPDGTMVLLPGGLSVQRPGERSTSAQFCVHLFNRKQLVTGGPPTGSFVTPCSPSIAVRFHPKRFFSQNTNSYFYVYAVTTASSFYVLRSDKPERPIAFGTEIHCTAIVDAAWCGDATLLGLCSTDGYITMVKFEEGELGGVPVDEDTRREENGPLEDEELEIVQETSCDEKIKGEKILDENDTFKPEELGLPFVEGPKRRITPQVVSAGGNSGF